MKRYWGVAAIAMMAAAPASAEDKRDYCPRRPGIGTNPCTISAGHVSVETALADWTLERGDGEQTDTILFGDTLVRVGVSEAIEVQVGWTPVGVVRDRSGGSIDRRTRAGDVTLAIKANLLHPDGKALSVAMRPFVTLPAGRMPVGKGDWSAGLSIPVSYELSDALTVQTTSMVEAAVDKDGRGRHGAYGEIVGLEIKADKAVSVILEAEASRDNDPEEHRARAMAAASLAWMANDNLQLDAGLVAGLNRAAPDVELSLGISRRF